MADVYVPAGWPPGVDPPGTENFVPSAVNWLYDLVPDLRGKPRPGHPVILAAIAKHVTTGAAAEGARAGYRTARNELGEAVPPHAVDVALTAYRDEGRPGSRPRAERN